MFKSMKRYIDFIGHVHKNRIAICYLDGNEIVSKSFNDIYAEVVLCAANLQKVCGDVSGKHISLVSTYDYQYVIAMLAIAYANAISIPFNVLESADVIREELKTVDTDIIVTNLNDVKRKECEMNEYPIVERDILFSEKTVDTKGLITGKQGGFFLFTSGSTGKNKAVVTSLPSLFSPVIHNSIYILSKLGELKQRKIFHDGQMSMYLMVPAYHIGGLVMLMIWLLIGNPIHYCFKPQYMYRELEKMPSDISFSTPVVFKMWAKDMKKGKGKRIGLLKLFVSGAAPIDSDTIETFKKEGKYIVNGYGMTECSGVVAFNLNFDFDKMASVGWAVGGHKIAVRDGEILIHMGRHFKGYYNLSTNNDFENGWLHTGDLGHYDGKYLYITGRKKNLIVLSSGENVSPEELENLIYNCEAVDEVKVYGDNDMIMSDIFCKESRQDEVKDFIKRINEKLPIYKRIKRIIFTGEPLKKTATGKIKR